MNFVSGLGLGAGVSRWDQVWVGSWGKIVLGMMIEIGWHFLDEVET